MLTLSLNKLKQRAGAISKSIGNACSIIERAIQAILICPEILGSSSLQESDYNFRAQIVLCDLIAIRGSIIKSKCANYDDYGIDFDN